MKDKDNKKNKLNSGEYEKILRKKKSHVRWLLLGICLSAIACIILDFTDEPYVCENIEMIFTYKTGFWVKDGYTYEVNPEYLFTGALTIWGLSTVILGWLLGNESNKYRGISILKALQVLFGKCLWIKFLIMYLAEVALVFVSYMFNVHILLFCIIVPIAITIYYTFKEIFWLNDWKNLSYIIRADYIDKMKELMKWIEEYESREQERRMNKEGDKIASYERCPFYQWDDLDVERKIGDTFLIEAFQNTTSLGISEGLDLAVLLKDTLYDCYRSSISAEVVYLTTWNLGVALLENWSDRQFRTFINRLIKELQCVELSEESSEEFREEDWEEIWEEIYKGFIAALLFERELNISFDICSELLSTIDRIRGNAVYAKVVWWYVVCNMYMSPASQSFQCLSYCKRWFATFELDTDDCFNMITDKYITEIVTHTKCHCDIRCLQKLKM